MRNQLKAEIIGQNSAYKLTTHIFKRKHMNLDVIVCYSVEYEREDYGAITILIYIEIVDY